MDVSMSVYILSRSDAALSPRLSLQPLIEFFSTTIPLPVSHLAAVARVASVRSWCLGFRKRWWSGRVEGEPVSDLRRSLTLPPLSPQWELLLPTSSCGTSHGGIESWQVGFVWREAFVGGDATSNKLLS